ncbi:MAG: 2-amino-4-hydroxy-6-hydroxymethyldihydropteridinepyrophosphokinase (EC [uncultured Sulfurovum sp.]|uniref:2-amino-4-hydroxy-6-hydroxymethyldihydropteridine pyrophosphokinase n=1 Tax=uncultured Sulfurovum sp. TaxID=269237 RepID=A0A6S6U2I8_9BACT|nr:MAG: 2-amino-4-hydroxy-6-hydroxymethyldihydropteridinepyrophosphokinase (EC [uncultured Sulfurovum sp.]
MLAKKLDERHTLVKTTRYPRVSISTCKGHSVLLGIGGNIGDVVRRFNHLFVLLKRSKFVEVIESSPILINPPFGYVKQKDFYNALLLIKTPLTPKKLLRYLLHIEKKFGRKRSFQDAPRTLDIDIIFYENVTMQTESLTLPHHGWMERLSVLVPLSYMKGNVA